MIANLLAWFALGAQTISAAGAGFALCISRAGEIHLQVAGTPCDGCADGDADDDDARAGQPHAVEPADGWSRGCDCLHFELSDAAMTPLLAQYGDDGNYAAVLQSAVPELSAIGTASTCHGHALAEPASFLSQLALLESVMLRC